MDLQTKETTERVRTLNDLLRNTFMGGVIVTTRTVAELDNATKTELLGKVMAFDDFSGDNDPHGEHDFGAVDVAGNRFFWKIDYYDRSMEMGSPDPASPYLTKRVLTIMRADEY